MTLSEGPCVNAYHDDKVVLEPNLVNPTTRRWAAFTPRASQAGVRAVVDTICGRRAGASLTPASAMTATSCLCTEDQTSAGRATM